ncbi:uncharacterized protein C2orf80 homolog isoform X1 [Pogona vitticeps]
MPISIERKRLKKEIEKLLGDYVGIKLRENAFDPQGKRQTSFLDDLKWSIATHAHTKTGHRNTSSAPSHPNQAGNQAEERVIWLLLPWKESKAHYDLAINLASPWLSDSKAQIPWEKEKVKLPLYHLCTYPNRMEREAMILSSYAGMLMNTIPVEDIIGIYNTGPSAAHWRNSAKGHWIHPCNLSLHPFAMLTAPQAAEHARKQSIKFHRATASRNATRTSKKGMDTK